MSTNTQQRYIVHLDVSTTADDAVGAVSEALAEVRRGRPRAFEFSVEEVHESVGLPGGFADDVGAVCSPYSGEFLG
ncbi:hypothetical protein [Pengzhenrongella phosphoraccumulans]|uniref:hypothetical protein n=1 Tax=Pengzhenrongella phosphoraccumulans TaxID=3114394 RepID=UPI00388D1998